MSRLEDDDGNDESHYWGPEQNLYDDEIIREEHEEHEWTYFDEEGNEVDCPINCDFPERDHTFCARVAERLYTYSQPSEPKVDYEFLARFEKHWKFWLYIKPNTLEGDTASETISPLQLPIFYPGAI